MNCLGTCSYRVKTPILSENSKPTRSHKTHKFQPALFIHSYSEFVSYLSIVEYERRAFSFYFSTQKWNLVQKVPCLIYMSWSSSFEVWKLLNTSWEFQVIDFEYQHTSASCPDGSKLHFPMNPNYSSVGAMVLKTAVFYCKILERIRSVHPRFSIYVN